MSHVTSHGPAPVIDRQRYQPLFAAVGNPDARNHEPGTMPSVAGFVVATTILFAPTVVADTEPFAAARRPITLRRAPTGGTASTTVPRPPSVTAFGPVAV